MQVEINLIMMYRGYFDEQTEQEWKWKILTKSLPTKLYEDGKITPFKGIFRDHSRDNALNFHKIRDVCILVMVLDV